MKISYYKTENVALDRLHEIQGKLKELTQVNLDRLWKSMSEDGFAEPFVVWEDTADKKLYVVGGHQRLRVLKTKKRQGVKLPTRFPCNFTRCKDRKAAVILCGRLASQYGRVTDEGLYQFAIDNELEPEFLKENFEFPGLNIDNFINGYMVDNKSKENGEIKGNIEFSKELLLEHNYIVLYFDNNFDWQVAQEKFKLKRVKDLIPRKEQPIGVGRVINGSEWLDKIND